MSKHHESGKPPSLKRLHPATQKAELRAELTLDRVWTTATLRRRGLTDAAEWLALPRVTYSCRMRGTHPESLRDLEFMALDEQWLHRPQRELMHYAGMAELRRLTPVPASYQYRLIDLDGLERRVRPDGESKSLHSLNDVAVEFDAGYPPKIIRKKIVAFAELGYHSLLWGTTIHQRTTTVASWIRQLDAERRLFGLRVAEVVFVDLNSKRDPYSGRPRCHKAFRVRVICGEGGTAGK